MAVPDLEHPAVRRGRAARQSERLARTMDTLPYLTRKLPPVEVISTGGLEQIEANADTLLEQVGIEIVNFPDAVEIFRGAGADVTGTRVRFPRGMCRALVTATAPRIFTQRARNDARSVQIGDPYMVLVPTYGSPFIHNLDEGRRYATIEDFRNFVKLTYTSRTLHHGGGTLCEPVDLPVNKRHLEMVYSHIRYSDRAFMGSVTHPSRAQDSVEMARIVFGAETMEREHVIMGLANANSPMSWDFNMLGSAKVYAENNQIMLITPFILGGAMAPVTVAAQATQTLAEALAGMAFCQIVKPGAPVIFGSFASSMSMQSGAPTFGTPEPQLVLFVLAALARRLGVPFRSGGNFTASKLPDYQAAYESAISYLATMQAGVNFNLPHRGLARGRAGHRLREIHPRRRSGVDDRRLHRRRRRDRQRLRARRHARRWAGTAFPRVAAHAGELRGRVLAVRDLQQRQLRAMAARRRARRRPAGERALEAPPGRVRDAAPRRGDPRRADGMAGSAQGELPGFGRLGPRGLGDAGRFHRGPRRRRGGDW
ncbi:MAG TPA: trimethylamine methyltransferase family protein [Candidatus Limnocylindrales bacterium]